MRVRTKSREAPNQLIGGVDYSTPALDLQIAREREVLN
jgi:hypothetical protein